MMPALRTMPEALDEAARGGEGYIFLVDGRERRVSYAALHQASCGVARALRETGLRPGDLVALVLADPEQFLTTLFGASLAGLVPASLDPPPAVGGSSPYFELTAHILRTARARAVVTGRPLVAGFAGVRAACPDLALLLAREELVAPPLVPDRLPSLGDVAFVQFTSGSTSAPKGVVLSHGALSANVDAINGPSGLATAENDVAVSWLPLYHDMGLVGMALGPLYSGRPGVLLAPQAFVRRPAIWLRAISHYRGTISFAPNFAYDLAARRIKDRDLDGLDLSCWRVAGCGAEPIHAPTLAAFVGRFAAVGFRDSSFLPCYGLAEHVLAATFPPRDRTPRVDRVVPEDLARRRLARPASPDEASVAIVSCGRAFPGHELRIVGEDGRPLGERKIGEIALAGPSVMLGYHEDEALTGRTIRGGWLHTGDLGYLSEGELFVCGRAKDLIIVNGRKYHPQDIEWAVGDLGGIRRGRVVAFGMAEGGVSDRVIVVVEPNGTVGASVLADAVRRRVGEAFGLPIDEVVMAPGGSIGRTPSGKVQRAATRAQYERGELVAGREGLQVGYP